MRHSEDKVQTKCRTEDLKTCKPQNVRSTFERLLGSKNEENVFVYFVRQKVNHTQYF